MTTIGYHCSHEQFSPRELLGYVQHAEEAGFEAAMCSDHFRPWNHAQGNSGYSFAWLGAALEATNLPMGLVVRQTNSFGPSPVLNDDLIAVCTRRC